MRRLALALATWLTMAVPVSAETPILSAPDAQAQVGSGEMILLDIRSPQEWKETGLAKGAWPVSMHERDFGDRLRAILAVYQPEQIALICATGGRTKHVTDFLVKNGITGITDVSEGMMGNSRGPGWIARGLEIIPLDAATKAYNDASAGW